VHPNTVAVAGASPAAPIRAPSADSWGPSLANSCALRLGGVPGPPRPPLAWRPASVTPARAPRAPLLNASGAKLSPLHQDVVDRSLGISKAPDTRQLRAVPALPALTQSNCSHCPRRWSRPCRFRRSSPRKGASSRPRRLETQPGSSHRH
jgi:hypothetical protein